MKRISSAIHFLAAALLCFVLDAANLRVVSTRWRSNDSLDIILNGFEDGLQPAKCDTVEITPKIDFRVVRMDNCVNISADFTPGTFYRITLKKDFPNAEGIDRLGEEHTLKMVSPDLPSEAEWYSSGVFLPLNTPKWELPIWSTNTPDGYLVTLAKLYKTSLLRFISSPTIWDGSTTRKIGSKTVACKASSKQRNISMLPLEELGIPRKPGIYALGIDHGQRSIGRPPHMLRLAVTDMGLFLFRNGPIYHVFVHSLSHPEKPLPGVSVYLYTEKFQLLQDDITDGNGYVRLVLPPLWDSEDAPHFLVATDERIQDTVWLTANSPWVIDGSSPEASVRATPATLFADNGIYQCGDFVTLTALLRDADGGLIQPRTVEMIVISPDGTELHRGEITTDEYGFARQRIRIPENAQLGKYRAEVRPPRRTGGNAICHATTSFEVLHLTSLSSNTLLTAMPDGPGKWVFHGEAVDNRGFILPNAEVETTISFDKPRFTPPEKYSDFTFCVQDMPWDTPNVIQRTLTDRDGLFSGAIAIPSGTDRQRLPIAPLGIRITSSIRSNDQDNATAQAECHIIHHGYRFYTGLKIAQEGNTFARVTICGLTPNGEWVPLNKEEMNYSLTKFNWAYIRSEKDGQLCRKWQHANTSVASGAIGLDEKQEFRLVIPGSGNYGLSVTNRRTGQQLCYLEFWHSSGQDNVRPADPCEMHFTTARKEYLPGDQAEISFESLFPGVLHYTFGGQGATASHASQPLLAGTNTIRLKIPRECSGGACHLAIQAVGTPKKDDDSQDTPFMTGNAILPLNQENHHVNVSLNCPEIVIPGDSADIRVSLTNQDGKSLRGRVILWGVDDTLLNLTGYSPPQPFRDIFKSTREPFILQSTYEDIFPRHIPADGTGNQMAAIGHDVVEQKANLLTGYLQQLKGHELHGNILPIGVIDVNCLNSATDETPSVRVRFPSTQCTYRILAVASCETGVGSQECVVNVENKVGIDILTPAAMLPGDRAILKATFTNRQSAAEFFPCCLEILSPQYNERISLAYESVLNIPKGKSVTITREIALPEDLPAGTMQIRASVTLRNENKNETIHSIQIRPPIQRRKYMQFQCVPPGETSAPLSINATDQNHIRIGHLQMAMLNHVDWIKQYPYDGLEQLLDTLLDHISLSDAGGNSSIQARQEVTKALDRLPLFRLTNGAYSRYRNGREKWDHGTVMACALEALSAQKGFCDVSPERREAIARVLENILKNPSTQIVEKSFACWALATAKSDHFYPYVQTLPIDQPDCPPFVRFIASMALMRGGYKEEATALRESLRGQDVAAAKHAARYQDDEILRLAICLWTLYLEMPNDPETETLFYRLMNLQDERGINLNFQAHTWLAAALGQYIKHHKKIWKANKTEGLVFNKEGVLLHEFDGASLPLSIIEPGEYRVRNTGSVPLMVTRHIENKEIDKEKENGEKDISIFQEYFNADGEKIRSCKVGDIVTLIITVNSKQLSDVVLNSSYPGGFQVFDKSIPGRFLGENQLNLSENTRGLRPRYIEKAPAQLLWFGDINQEAKNTDTPCVFRYNLKAVSPGTFQIPPVTIMALYDREKYAIHQPEPTVFTIIE